MDDKVRCGCESVFIAEEVLEGGDKGTGHTTTVDAETEGLPDSLPHLPYYEDFRSNVFRIKGTVPY
jgi:hypothetical protein